MSASHPASLGSRNWRWLVAFVGLALGTTLLAPLIWDVILSGLLMVELFRPLRPGPVMWVSGSPQEVRVTFPGRHRTDADRRG